MYSARCVSLTVRIDSSFGPLREGDRFPLDAPDSSKWRHSGVRQGTVGSSVSPVAVLEGIASLSSPQSSRIASHSCRRRCADSHRSDSRLEEGSRAFEQARGGESRCTLIRSL